MKFSWPERLRWTDRSRDHYDDPVDRVFSALPAHYRPTSTIRGALVGGFAVVFGLWLLSGYELVRRLQDVEQRASAEHAAVIRAERVLSTVRTNVLLGSIYLRDALIDNGSVTRGYYRDELNQIRAEIERLLPTYVGEVNSPLEREHWAELQTQLEQYWESREIVFSPNPPLNTVQAAAVLRRRVVPSRDTILEIVDRLSSLQLLSQRRHDEEVSLLYRELRNRLLGIGALAIVIGMVVAAVASRHVGRLEDEIERQRRTERQTRNDLERLSDRLVTVQEQERRSLARELHDEVGQALTAIKMDVAVALRGLDADARARSPLEDARAVAENTLQSVRDMSQLLHPSMLDDFGLAETLTAYLRGVSKRTGVRAQLSLVGMEQRLASEVEVCIYRLVQEAMTNVARHSGARNATVSLNRAHDMVWVRIEDDGRGLEASAPVRRGLGVIGMRERTQALNGTFSIETRREGGTRVTVKLPVAGRPPASAAPLTAPAAG